MLTPTGKATKKKSMWRLFLLKLTAGTNPSRHVSKIERFYSCGEQIYKFTGTEEVVYIRKEFNSHRTGFGNHHGGRFIILGQQRGGRDVI